MSNDKDYIKELFENDGISAPESLSEDNIMKLLNDQPAPAGSHETVSAPSDKKFRRKRPVTKVLLTAAATLLVAVCGVSAYFVNMSTAPDTSLVNGELYTFKSERDIQRMVNSLDPASPVDFFVSNKSVSRNELIEYEADYATDLAAGDTGSSTGSHSSTYLQVDAVDEADIVKTDGKYIYYVNEKREVVILSAKDGKTKQVSVIGSSDIENYIHDIYLKGDTLITVGKYYKDDDEGCSGIVVYDISDRSHPVAVSDFSQTGEILSSRMIGDYVYLVTNDYIYRGGRTIPMCGTSEDYKSLPVGDICCVPEPHNSSYIVLSAIDISSGKQGRTATKAVFGSSEEVYCSNDNLYTTSWEWGGLSGSDYTRIVRASLDGLKVKFDATTKVRGYIQSQFSMDESDGYFRVATTSERDGINVNNIYILDNKLQEIGSVSGFARNESIKAVRYVGSKAYVITYEAIDPLFVIDLSDPASPYIEGEVKIDGFSSLLVPISSDRLLGIGHATGDNGYGGEYDSGLKLALFDISDPSEPKVLDSKEFKDMMSPAQDDHHALTVNAEAGYYAIPYDIYLYKSGDDTIVIDEEFAEDTDEDVEEIYDDEEYFETHEAGVLVFSAGDSITDVDQHKLSSEYIYRSVYIGDYIYALDGDGNVESFRK